MDKRLKILGLTTIWLVFTPVFLHSQTHFVKFEHLSVENGLSSSQVFCIFQDRQGFLWFGTEGGLNRYDGYSFKFYRYDWKDSNSISHNVITAIVDDQFGNLWIGTGYAGINQFNRNTEKFTRFRHEPGNQNSLSNDYITAMYLDRSGSLWVGTKFGGLNKLICEGNEKINSQRFKFKRFTHDARDNNRLSHNFIRAIYEDKSGVLWVGTISGLDKFNKATGNFTRYMIHPPNSNNFAHSINCIYEDRAGKFWIGTSGGGLYIFDRDANQFIQPISQLPMFISAIAQDRTGSL